MNLSLSFLLSTGSSSKHQQLNIWVLYLKKRKKNAPKRKQKLFQHFPSMPVKQTLYQYSHVSAHNPSRTQLILGRKSKRNKQ